MPELPEVQTIIEDLRAAHLIGQTIEKAFVNWDRTVGFPALPLFLKNIKGKTIIDLKRRGKFIIFTLHPKSDLVVHLRMTGRLLLVPSTTETSPYIRLILELGQGQQLRFHDTRKFGRWSLVPDASVFLKNLGPEPLEPTFTFDQFAALVKSKKRALKPLLLDQTFLAGLGNIYVDEALWEARLHPLRKASSLNKDEMKRLYTAIQFVLQRGIESKGTTLGSGRANYYRLAGQQGKHQTLLQVFRQTGKPCKRCGQPIQRIIVAQRGTHICSSCQQIDEVKNKINSGE